MFLTAGTGAGIGLTIHAGQFIWKGVQRFRISSKQVRIREQVAIAFNSVGDLVAFDQGEFEECIRKLASCMTGVAVSGTFSIVLPHYVFSFLVNGVEVAYQLRKLRKMRDICGGTKELMENVSKLDIALQVSAGVCIKSLTTILFLGAADFNTFVDTMSHAGTALMALAENGATSGAADSATEAGEAIKAAHDNLVDHGLLLDSTALAGAPTEALSQALGDGTDYTPTWTDDAPASHWADIGVVNAFVEAGLARFVEEPTHKAINIASAAGEKVGSSKK